MRPWRPQPCAGSAEAWPWLATLALDVHRLVQRLAWFELQHLARSDGDLRSGLGIASLPSPLGLDLERTKPDQLDLLASLKRVLDDLEGRLNRLHRLFLCQTFFRHQRCDICLSHSVHLLPVVRPTVRLKDWIVEVAFPS